MATGKAVNQIMEEEEAEGEAVELHGVINPQEASRHVMSLDEALKKKAKFGTFLKYHGYCCINIVNCSYAKHKKGSN